MRRRAPIGQCRLCGNVGRLSFEHVPPQSAFNNEAVREIDALLAVRDPTFRNGRTNQRGIGGYALGDERGCKCNSNTGAWYGAALAELAAQVAGHLRSGAAAAPSYELYPLRVIKQVATMFFTIDQSFCDRAPEVAAFVLKRAARPMPTPYRVFIYATESTTARQGWLHRQGTSWAFAEITLRPLGYVLTAGEPAPHPAMQEITDFGARDYEARERVGLRLPLLTTDSAVPGDYRSVAEASATAQAFRPVNGARIKFVVDEDL